MRRLWAYIVLAFTTLATICASFTSVLVKTNSNIEYQDGKEIVFKISDKENKENELEKGANENIAKIMEQRLIKSGVSLYEVDTVGDDMVKVTFSEQNTQNYSNIIYYLTFNGEFALSTSNDIFAIGDELKTDEKAYLDTINSYPAVVLPINKDNSEFKAVIEDAQKQKDNGEGETTTNSDGEETKTVYLYLWANYKEGDTYEKTLKDNENYDKTVADKIILKFNFSEGAFFPNDKDDRLTTAVNVDTNGDGSASISEVTNAYNTARYFINLLNSEQLDYDVTYLYDRTVPAWTENLISLGSKQTVAFSKTFIATLICLLVITMLLIVFYRISASATFVITVVTLFGALGLSILFGVEFTLSSIIGLIVTGIISIASGIIYFTKLKEECYKGRTLKKANTEASKRSLLPIIDINVILMIFGAFIYLFGGKLLMGFASTTVLGGLLSLILNTLVLKGGMWLLTNNTSFTGKYQVFGVDPKLVPDLLKEEKQTYYGPYDGKDYTKNKKSLSIVSILLFVASLAGAITFKCLDGSIYNSPSNVRNSQIFFETTSNESALTISKVEQLVGNIHVYANGDDEDPIKLSSLVNEDGFEYYTMSETINNEGTENDEITHTYFVATLISSLNENTLAYYSNDTGNKLPINELINEIVVNENIDSKASASFRMVYALDDIERPNSGNVILATGIAIIVSGLYLMIRYRLSRGLASLVVPVLVGSFVIGLITLTRISVTSYIIVILPVVVILTYVYQILFMNKERELISEDKKHDNSIENRNQIMIRATALSRSYIIDLLISSIMISLIFFGFGPELTSTNYLIMMAGILYAEIIVSSLIGPFSMRLYALFSKINVERKPRKQHKKKKVKNKSAEPEEAIFIGIND